jgi:AmmeMemoRadiSam system protein A
MAPLRSSEASSGRESELRAPQLMPSDWEELLVIAANAVLDGLAGERPHPPAIHELPEGLLQPAGVFVTHTVSGELNGCIGTVGSDEPLGRAAATCSWQAAFADPRLPQLSSQDLDELETEVSVLSGFTATPSGSPEVLTSALRPDRDGLRIFAGRRSAIFLPSVWKQVADADEFVLRLLLKAGLPARHWPANLRAETFTTTSRRLALTG